MRYAYLRRIPAQVIIATNKEQVALEKRLHASRNVVVGCYYSEVIDPADYASDKEFVEQVKSVWDTLWEEAYHGKEAKDAKDAKQKEKEEGRPLVDRVGYYEPPFVAKPGMNTGWVQVRFSLVMLTIYASVLLWWYF